MRYKFIASDFDGTLLSSSDTISKKNVDAINKFIAAGGIFAVSTGRTYPSIMQRMEEIGYPKEFSVPLISYQGSLITDYRTKTHIKKILMDNKSVIKAVRYAKEHGVYCHIYSVDRMFIEKECDISEFYCNYNRISDTARYVGDLAEFVERENPEIIKVIYIGGEDEIASILNKVNAAMENEVIFTRSFSRFIECVSPDSGKGNAVLNVAERFNVDRSEIVCIGDSMNDASMIRAAALGVSVSNADGELKKISGLVAPVSNDEDAIAWVIEKILSGEL